MIPEPSIVIVGAGGHARVLIDILRQRGMKIMGAVDKDPSRHGAFIDDIPILGDDAFLTEWRLKTVHLVNAQGNVPGHGVSGLARRRSVYERFVALGFRFCGVVSPTAMISTRATIADSCQIITGAIVHPGAIVHGNALVNTGAIVDHDCVVGAHAHVAPGAVLCGGVVLGEACHVGARAVIIPQIRVGAGATIGAGAVVVSDVEDGTTVLGTPARPAGKS